MYLQKVPGEKNLEKVRGEKYLEKGTYKCIHEKYLQKVPRKET